jgi:hypothetical protein
VIAESVFDVVRDNESVLHAVDLPPRLAFAAHFERPSSVDDEIPVLRGLDAVAEGELIVEETFASASRVNAPSGRPFCLVD